MEKVKLYPMIDARVGTESRERVNVPELGRRRRRIRR